MFKSIITRKVFDSIMMVRFGKTFQTFLRNRKCLPKWTMGFGFVPDCFRMPVMCGDALRKRPRLLKEIQGHLETQEMCTKARRKDSCMLQRMPVHLKTQEMCAEEVRNGSYLLEFVPDHLKTNEMCIKDVKEDPWVLGFVLDWFVT